MTKFDRKSLQDASASLAGITLRSYQPGDAVALGVIFHRAVHEGTVPHYSKAEREAWSPRIPDTRSWEERLSEADTVVADTIEGPVGFMSLDPARAYLDLAYVLPEVMGTGVSGLLYSVLEGRARARGLTRLETEASLLAEPFFKRQGWRVVRRQKVERLGVWLSNALMEKGLVRANVAV